MNCIPSETVLCLEPSEYLYDRLGRGYPQENIVMAASIGFAVGFIAFNMLLYLVPVPSFIRRKFMD